MRTLLERIHLRIHLHSGPDETENDGGFTMLETVVGMVLMSIFLGIFSTAIFSMFNAANKAQSVDNTSTQLAAAFDQLDIELRYASYISTPGTGTDGNWYVEFQTANTGSPVCTQLRIANQSLQQRTWTEINNDSAATGLSGWTPIASGITNGAATAGSSTQPFKVVAASGRVTYTQATVVLTATDGAGKTATTSTSSSLFTAENTSVTQTVNPLTCLEEGRP